MLGLFNAKASVTLFKGGDTTFSTDDRSTALALARRCGLCERKLARSAPWKTYEICDSGEECKRIALHRSDVLRMTAVLAEPMPEPMSGDSR